MFTGLIEAIGEIREIRQAGTEATITLAMPASFSDCRIGDSISVDGVCLTITKITGGLIDVDLSRETLDRSTLGQLRAGSKVNLERAMRLSDRLGGHLVSGHIDGTGTLKHIQKQGRSWLIRISLDVSLGRYLIEKGSIAVDGISLTITSCSDDSFCVAVIPQTAAETTLLKKPAGSTVNLEIDMIAKYIEKLVINKESSVSEEPRSRIDRDMLAKLGFGERNGRV
ncbi:MAG: riboflavin synthase [Thermodesulfobacteriota bacterium]